MVAVLAYALRRTSARAVLAFALGGLVFVAYRALHVDVIGPYLFRGDAVGMPVWVTRVLPTSTSWDLAVGAAAVLVALVVAAALWFERPVRR